MSRAFPFLLAVLLAGGCAPDAPHDNPVDPLSPAHNTSGDVRGTVLHLDPLAPPIGGALVSALPHGPATLSDSLGVFALTLPASSTVSVVASKDGFLPDTLRVTTDADGKAAPAIFRLDAFPAVDSAQVITERIDHWWPGPSVGAVITANISDPDGQADVDTPYVMIDTLRFSMVYVLAARNFQAVLASSDIPGGSLEWLVGKPFEIRAIDRAGAVGTSGLFYVSRVIESEAVATYPTSQDTVAGTLVFQWDPPTADYAYTFDLRLFTTDGGMIWEQQGIAPAPPFSYQFPDSLPQGSYYWTVGIVDAFGNLSQSKEAAFIVP